MTPVADAILGSDIAIISAAALSMLIIASLILVATVTVVRPRMRLKRRLAAYGLGSASGGGRGGAGSGANIRQRSIQEKLQELEDSKKKNKSRRNQLRLDMMQAGVEVNVKRYVLLSAGLGLVALAVSFLVGLHPVVAIMIGIGAGLGVPKLVLRVMARGRQKTFTANFANAIDVLVRGMKSGLPVSECLAINGREAPDPVGEEFRLLVEGQKIGMSIQELLARGLERFPTSEYNFFAIVLAIQQQTGGNLASTLENLSAVLRERKKLRDKVKALSSEAKASAGIIGSLPFAVMLLLGLVNPDYIGLLFTERTGNILIGAGLLWMSLGVFVMSKMINFKV